MFSFQLLCFSGFDFLNLFLGLLSLWFLLLLLFVSMEFYYLPLAFPLFHPPVSFHFFCQIYSCSRILTFLLWLLFISCSTLIVYRLLCLAFNFSSSTHLLYSCFSSTTHTLVCFLFYLTFLVLCWSVPASAFLHPHSCNCLLNFTRYIKIYISYKSALVKLMTAAMSHLQCNPVSRYLSKQFQLLTDTLTHVTLIAHMIVGCVS